MSLKLGYVNMTSLEIKQFEHSTDGEIIKGSVVGQAALDSPYSFDDGKYVTWEWSYLIPDTGTIQLNELSRRVEKLE